MPPIAKPATERGYPKTFVLFFHEFVLFWGSGPLPGKIVSDGEVVQVKEQVLYLVLWGILDPQNRFSNIMDVNLNNGDRIGRIFC